MKSQGKDFYFKKLARWRRNSSKILLQKTSLLSRTSRDTLRYTALRKSKRRKGKLYFLQCSRETGEYRTRCIYIYIYTLLALRSKYKAKRGGGWHSEGTRVRSLFRSFINPPPWIQPASILLPTLLSPFGRVPLGPVARTRARRQAEI